MAKIYEFTEHNLTISGERHDMIALAEYLREAEGTLGDIRYQIEYAFDIDGVRSENSEDEGRFDPDYADGYLKTVRVDKSTTIHIDDSVASNVVRCVESEEKPEAPEILPPKKLSSGLLSSMQ